MRVNGKQDGFDRSDLLAVASQFGIKGAAGIIDVVAGAVSRWPEFASESGVEEKTIRTIGNSHRLNLALQ